MNSKKNNKSDNIDNEQTVVSLKTLADMLDAHRSSVRRWLQDAGIKPIILGRGKNGSIRYYWNDVKDWLDSLKAIE